jgi:hypothetical protein
MPDLTIEYKQQCESGNRGKVFDIRGYRQVVAFDERTEATCSCPAFKFSKTFPKNCKHIEQAVKELCDYHEQVDGPPDEKGVCPKCGGPTITVRVAV